MYWRHAWSINSAIVFPTSAVNAVVGCFVFTGLCSTFGFVAFFLGLARFYLMFVLVLDHFCTVFMPFWYDQHRIKVVLPSFFYWCIDVSIYSSSCPCKRPAWLQYEVVRNSWSCFPAAGCLHQRECFAYRCIAYTSSNACGVVSLVLCTMIILFHKARKLRNRVAVVNQMREQQLHIS